MSSPSLVFFFFNDTATTEIYTLSLHDALPISGASGGRATRPSTSRRSARRRPPPARRSRRRAPASRRTRPRPARRCRSEEHTSELQSPCNLVCRLLLEKKKKNYIQANRIVHL